MDTPHGETRYVIGADLGTTAVKMGLFDERGTTVAVDTVEHTLVVDSGGVIEQLLDRRLEQFV